MTRRMLLTRTNAKSVERSPMPSRCNHGQGKNGVIELTLAIVTNSRLFAQSHRQSVRTPVGGYSGRDQWDEQPATDRAVWRVPFWALVLLAVVAYQPRIPVAHGESPLSTTADEAQNRVTQITLGTPLDGAQIEGWTDLVLIAHPSVAASDADQIGELVRENAELLSFVLLARVERPTSAETEHNKAQATQSSPAGEPKSAAEPASGTAITTDEDTEAVTQTDPATSPDPAPADLPPAVLADIGVGLAMKVGGRWQIVTGPIASDPESYAARRPAPDLGFISGQVLRTAARSLDDMRIVVRRTTLIIHDSPAVLKLGDQNIAGMIRSMIWVDSKTGKLHHILWSLQRGIMEPWIPALDYGVYVPVPTIEDRVLHVQADRFTLGFPSATAFGLNDLPPGHRFSLSGSLAKLASRTEYDEIALGNLANRVIRSLRQSAKTP